MKTNEVTKDLIGRRVEGITFGTKVTGIVTKVEENEYSVSVTFEFDKPFFWGDETYMSTTNWARKADEFGSLKHLRVLEDKLQKPTKDEFKKAVYETVDFREIQKKVWHGSRNMGVIEALRAILDASPVTLYHEEMRYRGGVKGVTLRREHRYTVVGCTEKIEMLIIKSYCGDVLNPTDSYTIDIIVL